MFFSLFSASPAKGKVAVDLSEYHTHTRDILEAAIVNAKGRRQHSSEVLVESFDILVAIVQTKGTAAHKALEEQRLHGIILKCGHSRMSSDPDDGSGKTISFSDSAAQACAFIPDEPSPDQVLQRLRDNLNSNAGRFFEMEKPKWKGRQETTRSYKSSGGEFSVALREIADTVGAVCGAGVAGALGDIPDAVRILMVSRMKNLTFSWSDHESNTQKKEAFFDNDGVLTIFKMEGRQRSSKTRLGKTTYDLTLEMTIYRVVPNSPRAAKMWWTNSVKGS
jgi:hypothetical protein